MLHYSIRSYKLSRVNFLFKLVAVVSYLGYALPTELFLLENSLSNSHIAKRIQCKSLDFKQEVLGLIPGGDQIFLILYC